MPIVMTLLLAALIAQPAPQAGPEPRITLRIVAPDPLYLVGRTRVQATALDDRGQPYQQIAYMTLSVDGREMRPDSRAPFEWEVDVGAELDRHRLELAAVSKDGARTTLSRFSSTHPFVEAVGVNLVLVPAVVRLEGRPVPGLTAADFSVLEDGATQTVTTFSSEPLPASIVVALDNSRSMEGQLWSAQKAITEFVQTQPPYTSLAFMTFNDQVFLEQDFTYEGRQVAAAVGAARAEGTRTALYDAVRVGSSYLGKRAGARVLVIFTDGDDTVYEGDQGHLRSSIDAAQAADVTIFAVAYAGAVTGGEALRRFAAQTGGEVAPARSAKDLRLAFARITESIGSRYLLGYEPPHPEKPGYRGIEVRVSRSGAEVLARQGYVMR